MDNKNLTVKLQDAAAWFYVILAALPFATGLGILLLRPTFEQWLSGTGFGAGLLLCVTWAIVDDRKPDRDKHIYVKHVASGEWGWYPPREHPFIPFRDLGFTVVAFDYDWKKEKQEVKLPDGGKATVTFSWRPDLKDLRQWIESTKDERIKRLREMCARELPPKLNPAYVGRGIEFAGYALKFTPPPLPPLPPAPPLPPPPRDELYVGKDEEGKPVFLDREDRIAHVQIIGASRFGKSKLAEHAMRQLMGKQGLLLIDPNEQLYSDILDWCAHKDIKDGSVIFLDPSDEGSEVGFNPFLLEGERTPARIAARASRLLKTSLRAMKFSGDSAVLAERIMSVLFYVLIEQQLPVTELRAFLVPRLFDRRDEIMSRCQSEEMSDEWDMLAGTKKAEAYVAMMQSSATRLVKLFLEPGVKRVLTSQYHVPLSRVIENGHTVVCNLKDTPDILSLQARDIIGTFLVDETWNVIKGRTKQQARTLPGFNLVIDEFHNFATPEFAYMLREGGKYGLHLWLINHALDDLDRDVRNALSACHTRMAFGGTSKKDAAFILEGSRHGKGNDLPGEINYVPGMKKRKFVLRRAGKRNVFCITPEVQEFPVKTKEKQSYLEHLTKPRKEELSETQRKIIRDTSPGLTTHISKFFEEIMRASAEKEPTRLSKDAKPETVAESRTVVQNDPQEPARPSPPKASAPPKQPGDVETDDFYH